RAIGDPGAAAELLGLPRGRRTALVEHARARIAVVDLVGCEEDARPLADLPVDLPEATRREGGEDPAGSRLPIGRLVGVLEGERSLDRDRLGPKQPEALLVLQHGLGCAAV